MRKTSHQLCMFIIFVIICITFQFCSATISGTLKPICTHPPDTCGAIEAVNVLTQEIAGTGGVVCLSPDTCMFRITDLNKGSYYLHVALFDSLYTPTKGEFGCRECMGFLRDPADSTKRKIVEIGFWHLDVNDVQFLLP